MPMNGSRCTPAHGAALLAMADPQIQPGRDPRGIRHGYLHAMLTTQIAGIDLDVATLAPSDRPISTQRPERFP
jgi:hypothetical protein